MRHAETAAWSTRESFVHGLDARVKLAVLLVFIVSLALVRAPSALQFAACFGVLVGAAALARLPLGRMLRTSLLVVPVLGLFSVVLVLSGDTQRAWAILGKSYLSAFAVLIAVATTPTPKLIAAGRYLRLPEFLMEVTRLVYRYLFVLRGQAQTMRVAFLARGGKADRRALKSSAGMIAVLFSRSYERGVAIDAAMRARGFSGKFGGTRFEKLRTRDAGLLVAGIVFAVGLHFV